MNSTTQSADCKTCSQRKIDYTKTVLVRQVDELSVFHALLPQYDAILLKFDELSTEENERWGDKLFANYNACGCTAGAYFMLAGFTITIIYVALWLNVILSDPIGYLVKGFIIWIVSAVLGKLVGLIFAKVSLAVQLSKLQTILKQRHRENTLPEIAA